MKNKLITILVCGLMLVTLLPVSALAIAIRSDSKPVTSGILDKTTIRGFAIYLGTDSTGKSTHFFALRLHYSTVSLSGVHSNGVVLFRPIDIPTKMTGYHGHFFIWESFRGALNV
ncbi:MAG TPA: hypothetical protein DSN98_09645 [Thermoplasmata archaeon]|nr:MAG TPA: hypothetical protein DSN98_09645 [Thermoplasmata archaeon]